MKKQLSFVLAALLLLLLVASCAQTPPNDASASAPNYFPSGGFIEQDITPPGMTGQTHNVFFGKDGYIGLVSAYPIDDFSNATSWHYYTSDDNGESWETRDISWTADHLYTPELYVQENPNDKGSYINHMVAMENGALLAVMRDMDAQVTQLVRIDPDGSRRTMSIPPVHADIPSSLRIDEYLGNGMVLFTQLEEEEIYDEGRFTGYRATPSGCGIHNVTTDTRVHDIGQWYYTPYFTNDGSFYVQPLPVLDDNDATRDSWIKVDLNTGDAQDAKPPDIPDNIMGDGTQARLITDDSGVFYSIGGHGFVRYNNETGETDPLFGAEGFTFQSVLQSIVAARVMDETELFLATRSNGGGKLLRYAYDADKPDARPNTLRVYALRGSETLKLAEQLFEARHPDTDMVLETRFAPPSPAGSPAALDTADTPAASDIDEAARQLLTEVLAGEGPDVIILDGLPYSAYARQGLFEDVAELSESSGVASYITKGLRNEDGGLFVVPSHFSFPVLLGDLEDNEPDSLDALVDGVLARPTFVQAFPGGQLAALEEPARPQVYFRDIQELFALLLKANLPAVLPGKERVNRESLEELLIAAERIARHYDLQRQDNMPVPLGGMSSYMADVQTDYFISAGAAAMARGEAGQYWGEMNAFRLLEAVYAHRPVVLYPPGTSLRENYRPGFYGKALPTLAQAVYTPINLMGVSAAAGNKEDAWAFVALMLSKDMQTPSLYEGLPVTMDAMKQQYDNALRVNNMLAFEPEEQVIFDYEAIFSRLEYPYESIPALEDAFAEQALLYCTGAATLQQAVGEIESALGLYLQERYDG